MRRSKRLAAKNALVSETEGSSQEEITDPKEQDDEASDLRQFPSLCGYVVDKTPSKFVTKDHEENGIQDYAFYNDHENADAGGEEKDDHGDSDEDDVSVGSERLINLPDDEEKEGDFTLSTKSKKIPKDSSTLSSELQVDINTDDLYLKFDKKSFRPVSLNKSFTELTFSDKELMKRSVITSDFEKRQSIPHMHVSKYALKKQRKKAREETAGPMWFNLPATQITPEIEQDMKIMKMRNILDRKRHYKKNDKSALPKYFQIGTVVEGSADFYASRIPKRQRKSNMIDELLADAEFRRYNKKKYLEIQASKQRGKKGFYKQKMNRRKPTWSRT